VPRPGLLAGDTAQRLAGTQTSPRNGKRRPEDGVRSGSNLQAGGQVLARSRRSGSDAAFALGALAGQLARTPNGLGLLARLLFGRLLVEVAKLHLAENAFALQLLFQRAKRLVNVVIANDYLQRSTALSIPVVFRIMCARPNRHRANRQAGSRRAVQ